MNIANMRKSSKFESRVLGSDIARSSRNTKKDLNECKKAFYYILLAFDYTIWLLF